MERALFACTVHNSCGDSMIDRYAPDDTDFFDSQRNKCLNKLVEWQIFRNFIVNNQIVMNKIKPLDQDILIGANTHNHAAKVVNKFGSQDSILYNLKEFSSSVLAFSVSSF